MNRILPLLLLLGAAGAFAPPSTNSVPSLAATAPRNGPAGNRLPPTSSSPFASKSATALCERQWNFNQGRGPWGLKRNAEVWNGRVAQIAFVVVLLQEAVTGKGCIQAIQDGDLVGYFFLGLAVVGTLGLTGWLAIKGDESDIEF